jgi:hypothetical protein
MLSYRANSETQGRGRKRQARIQPHHNSKIGAFTGIAESRPKPSSPVPGGWSLVPIDQGK